MGWAQTVSGFVLIAALVAVAGFFLVAPARSLRQLAADPFLSPDEIRFQRRQAYRRLAGGVLILLLALLLLGAILFLEAPAQSLADWFDAHPDPVHRPPLTAEQETFQRFYGWYWLVTLVVLFALVVLAAWDYLANRRYGNQHRRRIVEARRAMIAREAERLRGD